MNSGRHTALSPIGMCYLVNTPSLKPFWMSTTAFHTAEMPLVCTRSRGWNSRIPGA